jgi:hypothetical protein
MSIGSLVSPLLNQEFPVMPFGDRRLRRNGLDTRFSGLLTALYFVRNRVSGVANEIESLTHLIGQPDRSPSRFLVGDWLSLISKPATKPAFSCPCSLITNTQRF